MQIGTSFSTNTLSLLRNLASDTAAQSGAQGSTQTATAGWRGHHQDRDRSGESRSVQGSGDSGDDGRLQSRLQRLSAMLQRLTEQNPDAQGASYAAIVLGGQGGAVAVATTSSSGETAGDVLVIQAQDISDVTTSAGADQVRLTGTSISGIYTGAGSDSVSIVGAVVSGIHTDEAGPSAPPPPPAPPAPPVAAEPEVAETVEVAGDSTATTDNTTEVSTETTTETPAVTTDPVAIDTSGSPLGPVAAPVIGGNDALSIAAYLIQDISTGSGDDALALAGKVVADVDAGSGNDAIAIRAKVVSGINGGEGDDAIAVDAGVGVAGLTNAAAWFAYASQSGASQSGTSQSVTASTGDATAQVSAAAARAYADIDGGAGNDVITVRTGSVLAVAGGAGNDTINAQGGTISLVYGSGDGDDTVNVAAGAQVVLQINPEAGPYTVEFGEDGMTVKMAEGSVTFKGLGAGTIGITQGDGGMALITQPSANPLNLAI